MGERVRSFLPPVVLVSLVAGFLAAGRNATAQPADDGFYTIAPCRLVDTRGAAAPLGGPELVAATFRFFKAVGNCQIPDSAVAVAVNVTIVAPTAAGHLRLFAGGYALPATSTINYQVGQTRANNAVVGLGVEGTIGAFLRQPSGTAHLVIDVTGYFATSGCAPAQRLPRPLLTFRGDTNEISWEEIPGATAYDLYVRAVPGGCTTVPMDVFVTRADQRVAGVTSPHDVSGFNQCGICYLVDVVAVGACDSPLASDEGYPAPLGFGASASTCEP